MQIVTEIVDLNAEHHRCSKPLREENVGRLLSYEMLLGHDTDCIFASLAYTTKTF